jgi:hypothetical protein
VRSPWSSVKGIDADEAANASLRRDPFCTSGLGMPFSNRIGPATLDKGFWQDNPIHRTTARVHEAVSAAVLPLQKHPSLRTERVLSPSAFSCDSVMGARWLLGSRLVRTLPDGRRLSGRIVECEAYVGPSDAAAHR